jgi:hypothetical protein
MFIKEGSTPDIRIGPFLDDGDGKTPEPSLSIGQADIRLSKNGGDFAQRNSSSPTNLTHDENGYYILALNATDTNTVGRLDIAVSETGALPVLHHLYVVEANIYDALFASGASAFDSNARVDVASIEGSDATDQINAACDTALSDYDAPTKAEMDSAFSTTNGKIDTVDTVVDAILVDTAEIGSAGAGLTAVPWNSSWDAEVQSECADALNAYDPPTKAEMDAMWTTAQTESYASDGAAATPAQLLYMIYCAVGEFAISSTTITGKKLDGSTTAMTWTINDASNPTSRTRAS